MNILKNDEKQYNNETNENTLKECIEKIFD